MYYDMRDIKKNYGCLLDVWKIWIFIYYYSISLYTVLENKVLTSIIKDF